MTFTDKVRELELLRAEAIGYILHHMNRKQLKRFLTEKRKRYTPHVQSALQAEKNDLETEAQIEASGLAPSNHVAGDANHSRGLSK